MDKDFDSYWRRRFEKSARCHKDDHAAALWSRKGLQVRKRVFFDVFRNTIGGAQTILDLGCGPGVYTNALAAAGHKVCGLDFAFPALQKARAKAQVTGHPFSLVSGNGYHLPFRDATFDIVICLGVLQNLSNEFQVLQEIDRVLRAGGLLFLMTRNSLFLPNRRSDNANSVRSFNPFGLWHEMARKSYRCESIHGIFIVRNRRIRFLEIFLHRLHRLNVFSLPLILGAEAFLLQVKKR